MSAGALAGKAALITGASGGIGQAIARAFAGEGAALALHYGANRKAAETLAASLKTRGAKPALLQADLRDLAAAGRLAAEASRALGRLDVLVNNAGAVTDPADFLELSPEAWEETFRVNVTASFLLAREAFKIMKAQGGGRIINVSSIAARFGGSPKSMHNGASKAAVEAMTIGLARFGAPHKILVNAIRPGVIDTPMHEKFKKNMAERVALIPLKRMGRPEEVASLAAFLAGDGGAFITGQTLAVTGGE